jgi:hypothetical protein
MPKSVTQTVNAAVYLLICFYIVCIANSVSDDMNLNNRVDRENRKILPDPIMRFLRHVLFPNASPLEGRPTGNPNEDLRVGTLPDVLIATSILSWLIAVFGSLRLDQALTIMRRTFWITGASLP